MSYSLRQNPANGENYTKGRTVAITEVFVHHAATTDFDGIGRTFQNPNRSASAHYGIGRNNNVDQYVQEGDIAWHCGNWTRNTKSIGIENVNMTGAPDWAIDEATINTLVELLADIARRNPAIGRYEVGKNLFGHKDVQATACPGQLYGRLQELARRANAILDGEPTPTPTPTPGPDQVLHVGERFKFADSYRVDNLAFVGGIWQIYTQQLCPVGFTWADNGIPAAPVNEVGGGAGNPDDQVLQVGSLYNIPGTYEVLDIGQYQDRWLAKIDMGGWKLWVDVETVTEV